uniref:Endolytic murein transglycosylase n=1 Tax=candidate division WOR-3 bacterium TaxID=2052148 RepID=A0A7V3VTI0_UNCW3
MKKIFFLGLVLIIFLCWLQPLNFGKKEIYIPKNTPAKEVAGLLSSNHIILNPFEFLLWLKILKKENHIRYGRYVLSIYKNPIYIINRLTKGGRGDVTITIPEGLILSEVAEMLHKRNIISDKQKFLSLCNNKNFIKNLGLDVATLEGYLFPDTYCFEENEDEGIVIKKMVDNFKTRIKQITTIPPESLKTVIIIASLVEKEAKIDPERPIIARVFFNRLKLNRPLESCATVIYAYKLKNPDTVITHLREWDLKYDSPYNTYLYSGLPPGPICSPGINSIKAALFPADVGYLYFVAKGDGTHHFSKTYREHLEAKEYYNAKK